MTTETNAILIVRRLPDYVRGMTASDPREMVGTARRTNSGVIFNVPNRGNFVWEGSSLTRVDGEGTYSRYIVEEFEVEDAAALVAAAQTTQPVVGATALAAQPVAKVVASDRAPTTTGAMADVVDSTVEAAIMGALVGGASLKMREIQETTKLSDEVLRPALAILKGAGKLVTTGQTRGTRYGVA